MNARYIKDLTPAEIKSIAVTAYEAGLSAKPIGSVGGCGRVYVELGPLRSNAKAVKILEASGFKVTSRPYSTGVRVYVGYDNASGLEFNRGELVAKAFNAAGVSAYVDGDGD